MKVVIDTSSLLALVRYYLPFDSNSYLLEYFKKQFLAKELIIIDRVLNECNMVSGGIIVNTLTFLQKSNLFVKTKDMIPPSPVRYSNLLNDNFRNKENKTELSPEQIESLKNIFQNSADNSIILYCLNNHPKNTNEELVVVTEETARSNDNKVYKKIPVLCAIIDIYSSNLPTFLKQYCNFEIK